MTKKTLVMGIGNILRGDDGIGYAVVEAMQQDTLPPHVDLLDAGTAGFELVLLMQGYDHVIVVDAAEMGLKPGAWRTFSSDEVRLQSGDLHLRGTLHYAGLAEALNLAAALDILPPQITIIGVQPESIDWQQELTPAVAGVITAVRQHILSLLAAEIALP